MSYTALYRKWRPKDFKDVKGQDAIVTTLQNQIKSNRIGHAYLFCGTRGTGKTSIAKIFAKAVNCENPIDGNPCGECASCKLIAAGNSMNVIEIDAASNNSVEDVRQIRENVAYSPADAKYKVYIIDEVHMLSQGAFNALLKTLEEPPSYVIFILATTESHKIPVTILSRCQRYDFKRIPQDTISSRLHEIISSEKIAAEEKAIEYIARIADGGMRDALSLLDQCSAFFFDSEITYEKALEVLGAVDTSVFSIFLRDIVANSIVDAIHLLDKISVQGRDLTQFVIDFTWYLRNILLVKASKDANEVVDISAQDLRALKEEAKAIPEERIMRYIRVFSELSNDLKYSVSKRILIEMAIIKLCKPQMETSYDSVVERLCQIEERIEKGDCSFGGKSGENASGASTVSDEYSSKATDEEQKLIDSLPAATKEDLGNIQNMWGAIVRDVNDMYKPCLREAIPSVRPSDGKLIIQLMNKTMSFLCDSEAARENIGEAISKHIGKKVEYEISALDETSKEGIHYPGLSMFNMDVEKDDSVFDN